MIEGCGHGTVARGWCEMHYDRWRKHGDPLKTLTPTRVRGTAEERFWAKVDAEGDCWEWTGSTNEKGYGVFKPSPQRGNVRSHRFAWEILVGPIPEGLELDHRCQNRRCCNTAHLEPVTHAVNSQRSSAGAACKRRAAKITHCPKNHPYSGDNLIVRRGSRECRECKNLRNRELYQRQKDENKDA
jgi:hypothetical protein